MKKSWFICLLFAFTFAKSQTIGNITYTPANPNPGDTIKIFCDVAYPNIGCPLTSRKAYQVAGNNIILSAFRCVGMVTMICYVTDTFKIVLSSGGIYNFHYMPGLDTNGTCFKPLPSYQYPSAIKTIQINVGAVGIGELTNPQIFSVFPNPAKKTLYILSPADILNSEIIITNSIGQTVLNLPFSNKINISELSGGLYFLKIIRSDKIQFHSKFIKE